MVSRRPPHRLRQAPPTARLLTPESGPCLPMARSAVRLPVPAQTCQTGVGSKFSPCCDNRRSQLLFICFTTLRRRTLDECHADPASQGHDLGRSRRHDQRRHRLPQEEPAVLTPPASVPRRLLLQPLPQPPSPPTRSLSTSASPSSSTGALRTPPSSPLTASAKSPLNGTQTVSPSNSTNFHLTAKGDGGTTEANVRVTVRVPVAPTAPQRNEDMGSEAAFQQNVHDIFFDYDSYDLRPDAQSSSRRTPRTSTLIPPSRSSSAATATTAVRPNTTSRSAKTAPTPPALHW